MGKCPFCRDECELTSSAPFRGRDGNERTLPCDRWLYRDKRCIVTLDPTQLGFGHAIALPWEHYADLTDPRLSVREHSGLLRAIQIVAQAMKCELRCERVYVATLCDGVEHLHYHLVPRYRTDMTGFMLLGQREIDFGLGNRIGPEESQARARFLECMAQKLRKKVEEI
jgi:diadenosine tetraphosphate (Ap4A) HIT family hydrolase